MKKKVLRWIVVLLLSSMLVGTIGSIGFAKDVTVSAINSKGVRFYAPRTGNYRITIVDGAYTNWDPSDPANQGWSCGLVIYKNRAIQWGGSNPWGNMPINEDFRLGDFSFYSKSGIAISKSKGEYIEVALNRNDFLTIVVYDVIDYFHDNTGEVILSISKTNGSKSDGSSLRIAASSRDLYIGTAASFEPLKYDHTYREILAREFNILTPENAMKFGTIHPSRNDFNFKKADLIVKFAESHNMKIRGHALAWHKQLPIWLTSRNWSKAELINILHEHIKRTVSHFRGRVLAWDVVNEAINDAGELRDTFWLRNIGPEYIAMAFQWAHEADPNATLFYNDYGIETWGPKSQGVYNLISNLSKQGIPIHGVGLQAHITLEAAPKLHQLKTVMKHFNELDLEVQITEMDVRIKGYPTKSNLNAQAQVYSNALKACLQVENCNAFVTWGFTDRISWIPQFFPGWGSALIFDKSYHPKPAYRGLLEVLQESV